MTHSPADIQDVLVCMTGDTVNDIAGREAFERIRADLATYEFDRSGFITLPPSGSAQRSDLAPGENCAIGHTGATVSGADAGSDGPITDKPPIDKDRAGDITALTNEVMAHFMKNRIGFSHNKSVSKTIPQVINYLSAKGYFSPTSHAAELEKVRDELREVLAFYKSGDEKKTPTETGRIIGYEECIKAITAIIEKKGA